MATNNSQIILVVGMHRSGTSLLAHLLASAGAHLGTSLDTEPHPFNETGHWEHSEIVSIQEQLLIDLGREWHVTGDLKLPPDWLLWPETAAAAKRLSEIAARELGGADHWIVKDPRTIRLLPLWREIASNLAVACRLVVCVRDPREVAASVVRRVGMDRDLALGIWLASYRDFLVHSFSDATIVSFDDYLTDPAAVVQSISDFCGLELPGVGGLETAAVVRPDLRHHRAAADETSGDLPAEIEETYRSLLDGRGWQPDHREPLESLRAEVLVVMRTSWRDIFLPRGVRSVLAQTYGNWHLHIVNDGGPRSWVEDALAPYRRAIGERLTVSHLRPARGMEAASNWAIAGGRGKYIVVHDDDDTWHPRFLESTVACLEDTGATAVSSRSMWVEEVTGEGGIARLGAREFGPNTDSVSRDDLLIRNRLPTIGLVYRRSAAETIGPYREEMRALGDWEFNLRLAALGPIPVLGDFLANWHRRSGDDSMPNSSDRDHQRFLKTIDNVRRREQGLEDLELGPEVMQLESNAGIDEAAARGEMIDLEPVPYRGLERVSDGWMATSDDPQFELSWEGGPIRPGLYVLVFELQFRGDGGVPQLFFRWDGGYTEFDSIRFQSADGGHYSLLMNVHHGLSGLRLDPMDETGGFALDGLRLIRLADSVESLTRSNRKAGFPNVVCIGAQRSGTTWLWDNLKRHPRVWAPPVKEVHFFDNVRDPGRWRSFRQRGALGLLGASQEPEVVNWAADFGFSTRCDEQWYSRLFDDAPDGAAVCDVTPAYATLGEGEVERVARLMPDARVLFILRDPVERAISGALHELTQYGCAAFDDEALGREVRKPGVTARSDYRTTLGIWERFFPADRIGVFFFDDLCLDPLGTLNRITDFLGLDFDASWFPDAGRPRNRGTAHAAGPSLEMIRTELSADFLPLLEWLSQRYGGWADGWLRVAQTRLESS